MAGWHKTKRGILAAGTAATIFLGATYGAGLKTQHQVSERREKARELSVEQQIAILESQKSELRKQRDALERKLALFEETVRERDAKKAKATVER